MPGKKISPKQEPSSKAMTLRNFTDLADVMKNSGKLAEAEELYRTGLEGRERILGKDHPETLNCMHNLALVLEAKRKFDDAETTFRACLVAKERILGHENPTTCQTAFCLGDLLRKVNRSKEAIELFEYAYNGYVQLHGEKHKNSKLAKLRIEAMQSEKTPMTCVLL